MITLHTQQSVADKLYHDVWESIQALWNDDHTREAVCQFADWARSPEEFHMSTELAWVLSAHALMTLVLQDEVRRYLLHEEVKKVVEAAFEDFGLDLKLRHPVSGQILGRYGPPMSAYLGPNEVE